jgi:XRE family transcriptional regulator, regulator of sulfur utilization
MLRVLVGSNLRGARERAGLSVLAVHDQTGLARSYLTELERGTQNVSIDTLDRLASLYGVSIASLFRRARGSLKDGPEC